MQFNIFLLTITTWLYSVFGQNIYELVFLNERIFSPCENAPNNSIDNLFNMTNVNMEQTEDGSLVVSGYSVIRATVEEPFPLSIEIFKKERGTWQPTVYSQKRTDACTACFSSSEIWYSYMKNTPDEQKTCPFTEGQRLDFDINEPTYLSLPVRNGEGEYKLHAEAGLENGEFFVCVEIYAMVHKI